jgi:hypothetical protein
MKTLKLYFVLFFSIITAISFGQNNCQFRIDSLSIWTNKKLDTFLNTLQIENFKSYSDKKQIPTFLKEELDCWTKGDFSLANPDEEYQCCCTSSKKLPKRKLQYL